VFSTESAKDYLKEMQTQIGTVNSEELRARRRAEQIRASRAKKTPDRRGRRASTVKKRQLADS
jgi:hypothetical protein